MKSDTWMGPNGLNGFVGSKLHGEPRFCKSS